MRNPAMEASKLGCRRTRACLALGAVMLMGLHASVRAESKQEPPAPPTAAEPAPAPSASSPDAETNSTPAQAVPPSATAPAPPPPACVPPAPYDPPPGYGSPYDRPPPGYPYPPPGYPYGYRYPHYRRYDSPPPYEARNSGSPRRPTMVTFGVGFAALSGGSGVLGDVPAHSATKMGLSYALRLAFAANDKTFVVLALEGTTADFSGISENHDVSTFSSTTFTVGAQHFISHRMYLRLGVGLGCLDWDEGHSDELTCRGMAGTFGAGYEFFQAETMSTAIELTGAAVSYTPDAGSDVWSSLGLNVVLSLF